VWEEGVADSTDEEGIFSDGRLYPGNYFLFAQTEPRSLTFPSKLSHTRAQVIQSRFYPSGSDLAAAVPIPITPGKRFEVKSITFPPPFYRVSVWSRSYGQASM